jgi:hypothetical protein
MERFFSKFEKEKGGKENESEKKLPEEGSFEEERSSEEEKRKRIEIIEKVEDLTLNQKLDLAASFLLDEKRVVYLGDHKVIESEEEKEIFEKRFKEELEAIKKNFEYLEVPYSIVEELQLEEGVLGFNVAVGKERKDLEEFINAKKEEDDKKMGLLLGYPETAVQVYGTPEALDFERFFQEELSSEEREKLEEEGVINFLFFQPSRKNWREELGKVRQLQSLIKEKAPKLYEELIKQRSYNKRSS